MIRTVFQCWYFIAVAALSICGSGSALRAAVDRIEIQDRGLVANGAKYGLVGPYERISGRLHYSVDPESSYNAPIVDLALAPKDARGRVQFSGDFVLLTPLDPARGNGRLLYDVTNRGGIQALGRLNDAIGQGGARTAADVGSGFLFEQGYSLLWSGWDWDVVPGPQTLTIDLPIARQQNGRPITGRVVSEIAPTETTANVRHVGRKAIGYPPIRFNDPNARLSVRDFGSSRYTPLQRGLWSFGRTLDSIQHGLALNDPTWITLANGFEPGRVYRLDYQARNPTVVGLGLAALRDAMSFFRFEAQDSDGTQNPLASNGGNLPKATLAYGASQSGRVLNTLIWLGLHVDEVGRMVFDAAMIDVAGAGKGGFNFRFAQTSRHFSHDIELDFPTDFFPFSSQLQIDTETGVRSSLFDRAHAMDAVPHLFIIQSATDYWARSASLIHTETDGSSDVTPDDSVRIYMIAGSQHVVGTGDQRGMLVHCRNPLDHRPVLRALLSHLDAWVTLDRSPPPSRFPMINDETLVTIQTYRERFPDAAFLRTPEGLLTPPRLDHGPRFETEGIADQVPPMHRTPYTTLVPAADEDGLDMAGIKMPEIEVPLGTYTGWNPQNAATGAPERLSRWFGSFMPFARTVPEKLDRNDPRLAITERYVSKDVYTEAFAAATLNLASQELILGFDINPIIEKAGKRYEQIMTLIPNDESCRYLSAR